MADTRSGGGKKRKKKRSQMQMVKKFARQRYHGEDLDSDTYQYMVRILELIRVGFPSAEEKLIFVNNVYEQSIGHEVEYARNQVGSRVLDSLLRYATLEVIQRLVDTFGGSLRPMSSDKFASHVLQKIVMVCAHRGNREKDSQQKQTVESEKSEDAVIEVKDSEVKAYNDVVIKLSKYFINNIEEFVFDTYANHLLRTVIECLGGLIDKPENEGKKRVLPCDITRRPVSQEYKDLLIQSCKRLHKWPQFLEFGHDELTSGLLQSVLYSLKDIDSNLTNTIVKKVTEECCKFEEGRELSNIFNGESSVRLLEACLAVAEPKTFREIYQKFFAGNLKSLSLMPGTNFSVQRLLDNCSVKEDFEQIFEDISVHFSDILEKNHTGVLAAVGNASMRLQAKQGAFVNAIAKALHCDASEKQIHIVTCTYTLSSLTEVETSKAKGISSLRVNLHGSLMIQAMLNFNKPIKIVNSLLNANNEELLHLFSDPKGSRILDAFMDSKYIGEKSREKLSKKLQGCWAQLAQSTHGSRCLEKIWQWSGANQRRAIMDELASLGESLRTTKSGRIIATKLNVPLYARNKKDWLEMQGKEEKTRALFADVIGRVAKKKD
ncbi:hypothetical protein KM043_002569 [Ampulex compressa]|nr:hypothetical protein KM043_002569 [Ampulex compressa]